MAGEHQIRELQRLIDDTFQQFALDDSEDDFEDGDSIIGGMAGSTPNLLFDQVSLPSLISTSVTSLKDDVIVDSNDVIAPLSGSANLAVGHGLSTNSRPARHSFA